jgi:hypothetical protein
MLVNPQQLIADFTQVAALAGIPLGEKEIRHAFLRAPHRNPKLPPGSYAIYAFSLANDASVVLKVGKAAPKSADTPRYSVVDFPFAGCPRTGEPGSAPPNRRASTLREKTPQVNHRE